MNNSNSSSDHADAFVQTIRSNGSIIEASNVNGSFPEAISFNGSFPEASSFNDTFPEPSSFEGSFPVASSFDGSFTDASDVNGSFNETSSVDVSRPEEGENVMAAVMNVTLLSIGTATILLNVFVISLVAVNRWMRTNANTNVTSNVNVNVIICSMAVTDLVMGGVTVTAGVVKWTAWVSVRGGCGFCDAFYFLDVWAGSASVMHVCGVTLDRYLAIVFPLKHKSMVTVPRVRWALLGVWILTFAEGIGQALATTQEAQCILGVTTRPGLAFGLTLTSIFVPFVCVICMYAHIVVALTRKLRFMADSANVDDAGLERTQRKMFLTVSGILVAWIVCWLPLACILLAIHGAATFGLELDVGQFVQAFYYVEITAYGNSLVNPVLYFLLSPDFRKAARLVVGCCPRDGLSRGPRYVPPIGPPDAPAASPRDTPLACPSDVPPNGSPDCPSEAPPGGNREAPPAETVAPAACPLDAPPDITSDAPPV
jgi:hypothetical protein